jgi:Lrp/AsnC family transcriptional regulator for asnA, asnC and gidA
MHKIDKIDRMIVNLLMEDGRMPCSELARRLGNTTERAVRYRLERMRKEGLLKIAAVASPLAMGFPVITDVFIEVEPGMIQEVAQKLVKFENITYVACSTGDRDVSVQLVARSNPDAYAFVTGVIAKVPGVRKTTSSVVPLILKDVYDWHIPTSVDQNTTETKE